MSLLKSSATVGFFTFLSRISGFVRDMLVANAIGASWLSDAFFVAFKLPNFMRRLFAEGAFNAAFVPMFSGAIAAEGKDAALQLAREIQAALILVLLIITALAIIFMPWLLHGLAPGFADDPEKYALTVELTRITFPYIIFISLVCLLGGVLNSVGRFAVPAAAPILLNLSLIVCLIFLGPHAPTDAHALAIGVAVAGVVQFAWLAFGAQQAQMLPRLVWPRFTAKVKQLLWLMAPAALGAGVAQVNLLVDLIIASTMDEAVSYLYYADRINELPLGVIGIAVGTALLPLLSRQLRQNELGAARSSFNRAIEIVMIFGLPAAAALLVIAEPIIRVMYEHGAFNASDTAATYKALMAFAIGLPSFLLIKILAPGFFAQHDTKTPFYIATFCVLLNFVLNLILMQFLAHVGLALATSIAGWVNVLLMARVLRKRGLLAPDALLLRNLPRVLLASGLMALALYLASPFLAPLADAGVLGKIGYLAALVALGMAVYYVCISRLGVFSLARLKEMLKNA